MVRIKRVLLISGLLFSPIGLVVLLLVPHQYLSHPVKENVNNTDYFLAVWTASFAIALWVIITFLYLSKISPQHAMGAKYVSFLTPFMAILAALAVKYLTSASKGIVLAMLAGMFFLSLGTLVPVAKDFMSNRLDTHYLQNAEVIVLDNVGPGNWPAIMFHLQEEDQIFLARQRYLLMNAQEWLPKFCESNSVYVSFIKDEGTSIEGTEAIAELISSECRIELVTQTVKPLGIVKVYQRQ